MPIIIEFNVIITFSIVKIENFIFKSKIEYNKKKCLPLNYQQTTSYYTSTRKQTKLTTSYQWNIISLNHHIRKQDALSMLL